MAERLMSCNLCKLEELTPFQAPHDSIGVELMNAHLRDKHGVKHKLLGGLRDGWPERWDDRA